MVEWHRSLVANLGSSLGVRRGRKENLASKLGNGQGHEMGKIEGNGQRERLWNCWMKMHCETEECEVWREMLLTVLVAWQGNENARHLLDMTTHMILARAARYEK